MGICSSCESTQVLTAKLILQDGSLQEFSYPVKVSYVLNTNNVNPTTHFICNADEMDFDDVVVGINEDENIQLGQIYFALPLSRLKKPLQKEEMAALAVKASLAFRKSGERCGGRRKLVFSEEDERRRVVDPASCGGGGRRRRRRRGVGKFERKLSSIPE